MHLTWNLFRRSFYIFFTFEWEHARTCYQWVNIHVFLFSAIYCWFQHSTFVGKSLFKPWFLLGLKTCSIFKVRPPCSMLVEVWGDWASSAVVWMVLWRPTRHYCVSVMLMISFLNGGHWSFPAWLSICFLHFCHVFGNSFVNCNHVDDIAYWKKDLWSLVNIFCFIYL